MFPNRVFLGIVRGEALNEVTSGQYWPSNAEKFARLKESIQLIKKLWTEDWVNFKGNYYWVRDSKLYTKPANHIPLFTFQDLANKLLDWLAKKEMDLLPMN